MIDWRERGEAWLAGVLVPVEYARRRDLYGFELSPVMIRAEDNVDRWTAINDEAGRALPDWTGGLARDLPTPVSDAW